MREIKFRGRQLSTGKWIYGDLVHDNMGGFYVYPMDCNGLFRDNRVAAETVGQFTGLNDKNGKEIYEGDIVKWDRDQKMYVVVFRNGMYYASVEECNPHIYGGFPLWCLCEEEQHCTIVGNIHDNKKLLRHG